MNDKITKAIFAQTAAGPARSQVDSKTILCEAASVIGVYAWNCFNDSFCLRRRHGLQYIFVT